MPNMKKSIAFFISFIVTLVFVSSLAFVINALFSKLSQSTTFNIVLPLLLTLGLIFFMLFQGSLKHKWNKKILKNSQELIQVKGDKFTFTEKLWIYAIVFLIYLTPLIRDLSFKSLAMSRIILFLAAIAVVEFLLRFSQNSIRIIFLNEGIVVTGMDLRIDIPLGEPIHNASGYYPYSIIDGYLPLQDSIQLFIEFEQGKIIVKSNNKEVSQISYILRENKVEMRKFV
mgnify:FL=1